MGHCLNHLKKYGSDATQKLDHSGDLSVNEVVTEPGPLLDNDLIFFLTLLPTGL